MLTHTDRILEMFPHTGDIHNGVTEALMLRKNT